MINKTAYYLQTIISTFSIIVDLIGNTNKASLDILFLSHKNEIGLQDSEMIVERKGLHARMDIRKILQNSGT